jgi:hypothetical protein
MDKFNFRVFAGGTPPTTGRASTSWSPQRIGSKSLPALTITWMSRHAYICIGIPIRSGTIACVLCSHEQAWIDPDICDMNCNCKRV